MPETDNSVNQIYSSKKKKKKQIYSSKKNF